MIKEMTNVNGIKTGEKCIILEKEKKSFSEFIKSKRQLEVSSIGKKYLTTSELAERLNIGYQQFRKMLNNSKPIKKRDCIIAICAALRLNAEDTNEALVDYHCMPSLDVYNSRDDLLIDILENQLENPLTIEQINDRLIRNGFQELDIIDHRQKKIASKKKDLPYRILKKTVKNYNSSDIFYGDQYDSLSTEYSTDHYRCFAEMWLDDEKNKKVYQLHAGTDGTYSLRVNGDIFDSKSFDKVEDTGIFEDYFLEAEAMAKRELKNMLSILNDTKNYQERISAGICDDFMHVYAETYNYIVPELSEYYLFEYVCGHEKLTVLRKSEFMRHYMSEREYYSCYGDVEPEVIAEYNSLDELRGKAEEKKRNYMLHSIRLRYFKKLKEKADHLIEELKGRRIYIRHLQYIFDDIDRVCQVYGVEKEFDCVLDDEFKDMMYARKDAVEFKIDKKEKVIITIDDLHRAYELGFNDIEEICRVKHKLGSIEAILG